MMEQPIAVEILPRCDDYDDEWRRPAPCLTSDGSLLILQQLVVCSACGLLSAVQRISWTFIETGEKRPDLIESLGYGASVKHYFTSCALCGAQQVS